MHFLFRKMYKTTRKKTPDAPWVNKSEVTSSGPKPPKGRMSKVGSFQKAATQFPSLPVIPPEVRCFRYVFGSKYLQKPGVWKPRDYSSWLHFVTLEFHQNVWNSMIDGGIAVTIQPQTQPHLLSFLEGCFF